jgi:hypothetical protein
LSQISIISPRVEEMLIIGSRGIVSAAARLSRKAGGLKMDQVFWG